MLCVNAIRLGYDAMKVVARELFREDLYDNGTKTVYIYYYNFIEACWHIFINELSPFKRPLKKSHFLFHRF